VNAQSHQIVHGDKIREKLARAQCNGNQWDAGECFFVEAKKRFSVKLNLVGGVGVFSYVVAVGLFYSTMELVALW
jgi:hypothetical protein